MTVPTFTRRGLLSTTSAVAGTAAFGRLGLWAPAALAQASKVAELGAYQGSDREQRLLAAAKQEGQFNLYSNAPTEDNTAIVGAFEKKYGLKVSLWRAGSEEIRQRALVEAQAGRFDVDFILNNGPGLEALQTHHLLQEIKSPYVADLIPQAVPPHREWVGFCLNVLLACYNTNLVKKDGLPKSYADLLNPRWKGRLGIEVDDQDWFAGLMGELGEKEGVQLFRKISATNGFSVRKGHSLLANLVAAGEVPLALTVFSYTAQQLKDKGAPVDWFVIPPLVSMPNSIAVLRNAPHPNSAILFFDFMLGEAQKILLDRNYVPTSTKVGSPLERSGIVVVDSKMAIDQGAKWQSLYKEAISAR